MSREILRVTLGSYCPVGCSYCPQDKRPNPKPGGKISYMTEDVWLSVLRNIPDDLRISFEGFSEPLLHPKLVEFARAAANGIRLVDLYTTGVGIRNHEDISNGPFNTIYAHLREHVSEKLADDLATKFGCSDVRIQRPVPSEDHNDTDHVRGSGYGVLQNRAGNVEHIPGPKYTGSRKCGLIQSFKRPVLLPSGKCVLCCMDYSESENLGNLAQRHWNDLDWPRHSPDLCKSCLHSRPSWLPAPVWRGVKVLTGVSL